MEPPKKKRRHGPSPSKDVQDEDDDDELASHPQEIKIRRDPDIQFALKRANANQKLHATMAHIIEKYSRDFEGIGDEIDMATGEIVVNNGHLRNMRDEGDVEGLWVEGESNIDVDEGILLEDLTDEYSDIEGQANKIRGSQPENEISQVSRIKENDTEAYPQDQNVGIDGASNNVSSTASSQNEAPQDKSTALHYELPHDNPRLGSPSFGSMPPSAFGPWGMMPGFPMQAWGRDDIPPYFNMLPSMPGLWFTGGRYETASNSGQASIWGRNWTRKTKRAGSMKGSFKRTSDKQHSDAAAGIGAEAPDNDHGSETEITGGSPNRQEALLSDRTINTSDGEDGFLCSGTSDSTPIVQSIPVPSSDKALSKDPTLRDPPHKILEEINGNAVKWSRQFDEKDDSYRRRSGRARKQTVYMGKISWDDARELKKTRKSFTVRVRRADPSLREEFQSVDLSDKETEGEVSLLPEQTEIGSTSTDEPGTKVACQKPAVPDSQGAATPSNSSAPQRSQSKNAKEPNPFTQSMIPTTELSDDEAPLALSRIRVARWQNTVPMAVSPVSGVPTGHRERSAEPIDATSAPPKNNNSQSPEAKIIVCMVDHTMQPSKRKHGRPKGSTSSAKATPSKSSIPVRIEEVKSTSPTAIIASTTGDLPQSIKRKRGRPRKSVVASTIQDETYDPAKEVAHADDEVTENDQQRPGDGILDDEVSKTSPHLSHELRWLLKTKPKNSAPDKTCDTFLFKFVRPQKTKETFQQAKGDKPKLQDVAQEGKEVPKDIEDNLQEQTILQEPQELIQEADTIMGDVPQTREDSKSIQDYQPLPASPSSLPHDDGTFDGIEPPEGDEPVENDSPTLHMVTDDEAVESEESLPPLPQDAPIQEASTPRKLKDTRSSFIEPPSSSQKPHTPRHRHIHTNRAPSSRRSLLSFVSDSDSDTEGSRDELTRRVKSHSKSASVRPSSKKMRPATLTREVHRTPSKRRVHEVSGPGGAVKTPGGTIRTCGVDGYHCGRDYCFTCI
ncbi:hypothetical protein FVEN_g11031 [Fusarium venenatum]|uniref:Myb-like domain-containing protein n=1 Tax=Fusarium venenatum TaxID=56646 RepID=A0A2L2T8Y8_9HYPO|nr:uncharacterized protein FVRRES_00865 [Fusarium venenatum]KAG8350778.1 hypothetical protein FVEN_g11031 [Fusarium venenatum]KAH7005917.1 hypothetical protein EDB82DRAFT_491825 [Fusarium venenatum]CEI64353.1 unnamed protein product [Fusarium venenatum]